MWLTCHSRPLPNAGGSWLACTSGLVQCLPGSTVETILCIGVHVLPQIYVYSGPEGQLLLPLPGALIWSRRAAPLVLVLVGLSIAGSTAFSTAALVRGEVGLTSLSEQIDADLWSLQQVIDLLHTQVESLAEVVL